MPAVGETVGRYEIEAPVGQGGMASVYRVRHRDLGTVHALKVLHLASGSVKERLLQEGRVQAQIRHPNLVAVTDVVWIGDLPGLVLEFVDGPTLAAWIATGPHDAGSAGRLFRQIVAGVAHAHAAGLVHRDLKPQNVLLARDGDGYVARVADFGIAKVLTGSADAALTRSGTPIGTPRYMAPEQIRDASRVDARADVYSLGCILYELVCGEPPLAGNDLIALYDRAMGQAWTDPQQRVPDLPDRVARAIRGALTGDPGRRIPDCATLLAVLDGAPWVALPASVDSAPTFEPSLIDAPPPARPPGGGGRVLVMALAATALFAVVVLAWSAYRYGTRPEVNAYAALKTVDEGLVGKDWLARSLVPERVHYRIEARRGHVRITHRDAAGALLGHDATPIIEQELDRQDRVARILYESADGTLVRQVRLDWQDRADGGSTVVRRYLDADGKPMRDPDTHVFARRRTRDADGRLVRLDNLDASLTAADFDDDGDFTVEWDHDAEGNLVGRRYLGPDGRGGEVPVVNDEGFALLRVDRSGGSSALRYAALDPQGRPTATRDGWSSYVREGRPDPEVPQLPGLQDVHDRVRYAYSRHTPSGDSRPVAVQIGDRPRSHGVDVYRDREGRVLARVLLGPDGIPAPGTEGWTSRVQVREGGVEVARLLLGADGRPVDTTLGYAARRLGHDGGRETERVLEDAGGEPAPGLAGWCSRVRAWDPQGRLASQEFRGCGPDAALVEVDGVARQEFSWDGPVRTTTNLGADGAPARSATFAQHVEEAHDAEGRVVRVARRSGGTLHDHRDGPAAYRVLRDARGRSVGVEALDGEGRATEGPHGCGRERFAVDGLWEPTAFPIVTPPTDPPARATCARRDEERDRFGRWTAIRTRQLDGDAAAVDGCAVLRAERDDRGHVHALSCLAEDGERPVDGDGGFARLVSWVDAQGDIIGQDRLTATGAPATGDDPWRIDVVRDARGRPTRIRWFGADGLVRTEERTYGPGPAPARIAWTDGRGGPTAGPDGAAVVAVARDRHGRWSALELDPDGPRARRWEVDRDGAGRVVALRCTPSAACAVDAQRIRYGRDAVRTVFVDDGVETVRTWTLDERGLRSAELWTAADGTPIEREGVHRRDWARDRWGRVTSVTTAGAPATP